MLCKELYERRMVLNKLEQDFLILTQYVAKGACEIDNDWTSTDWDAIYKLCDTNKLIANTFDYVKMMPGLPSELLDRWEQYRLLTFFRQKKCFHSLKEVLATFEQHGIAYATFKGHIIADSYQNPYYRLSIFASAQRVMELENLSEEQRDNGNITAERLGVTVDNLTLQEITPRPTCVIVTHRSSVLDYCDRQIKIKGNV